MTEQREKPDFVVDPSGATEDVRRMSYASSQAPPSEPPGNGRDGQFRSVPPRQPKRAWYVIPIPIGLIIFLLVSLIRCIGSPEENPGAFRVESAYRSYGMGKASYFRGDYDMAIISFNMALQSESDVGDVYNSRGLAYEAKGEHARALADFDRALELMADSAMVYNNRAITHLALGNWNRAIADLDKAIELRPDLGKAYYNRGLAYRSLENYDQAISDFCQAVQFSTDWVPLPTRQQSDPGREMTDSISSRFRATQPDANLALVYLGRGLTYLAKGEYDSAVADLLEALRLQPDLDEAQNALTLVYAAMAEAPGAQATPMAAPTGERPVPIAVYVPQPQETPTTPMWKAVQVSCGEKPLYLWSSAGTYLYRIADASGLGDLVVVQRPTGQSPRSLSCDLLSVDSLLSFQAFGDLLTEPFRVGDSRTLSNCTPARAVIAGHGTLSTMAVGIEPRMTELGAFEAARVETRMEYSFATGLHDTFDVLGERSEWYVCGYGLVHSTAAGTETKNRTDGLLRYREATLISYTPTSTNESHVRHMLVDMQLSGNVDFYRARITDEETAEAVRRWDAGVRVVNVDEFERKMIDDRLHIVYAGTRNPILGSDLILTADVSP